MMEIHAVVTYEPDPKDRTIKILEENTITNDWEKIFITLNYWNENFEFVFDRTKETFSGRGFAKHPTTASFMLSCIVQQLPAGTGVTVEPYEVEYFATKRFSSKCK